MKISVSILSWIMLANQFASIHGLNNKEVVLNKSKNMKMKRDLRELWEFDQDDLFEEHTTNFPTTSSAPTRSQSPSSVPSVTISPSSSPTTIPTKVPTSSPSLLPSRSPSKAPSSSPTARPSSNPSSKPSLLPSKSPSASPTSAPSAKPSSKPSTKPSSSPSSSPSITPSMTPTTHPSSEPSVEPSLQPSSKPSVPPTSSPSTLPSLKPSSKPSPSPSMHPSRSPSVSPTSLPSSSPTARPSSNPSSKPSLLPSKSPSVSPTSLPSSSPTARPSSNPSSKPSLLPSKSPSVSPTSLPSSSPTRKPSQSPSDSPSFNPSSSPSLHPSTLPSLSLVPSSAPTLSIMPSSLPSVSSAPTELRRETAISPFFVELVSVNDLPDVSDESIAEVSEEFLSKYLKQRIDEEYSDEYKFLYVQLYPEGTKKIRRLNVKTSTHVAGKAIFNSHETLTTGEIDQLILDAYSSPDSKREFIDMLRNSGDNLSSVLNVGANELKKQGSLTKMQEIVFIIIGSVAGVAIVVSLFIQHRIKSGSEKRIRAHGLMYVAQVEEEELENLEPQPLKIADDDNAKKRNQLRSKYERRLIKKANEELKEREIAIVPREKSVQFGGTVVYDSNGKINNGDEEDTLFSIEFTNSKESTISSLGGLNPLNSNSRKSNEKASPPKSINKNEALSPQSAQSDFTFESFDMNNNEPMVGEESTNECDPSSNIEPTTKDNEEIKEVKKKKKKKLFFSKVLKKKQRPTQITAKETENEKIDVKEDCEVDPTPEEENSPITEEMEGKKCLHLQPTSETLISPKSFAEVFSNPCSPNNTKVENNEQALITKENSLTEDSSGLEKTDLETTGLEKSDLDRNPCCSPTNLHWQRANVLTHDANANTELAPKNVLNENKIDNEIENNDINATVEINQMHSNNENETINENQECTGDSSKKQEEQSYFTSIFTRHY